MAEIEENIMSCYTGLTGITEGISNSGTGITSISNSGTSSGGLVHQVLMFNELAIEQCIWWDDSSNKFLDICWEYSHEISLNFTSERELNILCDAIGNHEVHLASKATVAGIGKLSECHEPRYWSVMD